MSEYNHPALRQMTADFATKLTTPAQKGLLQKMAEPAFIKVAAPIITFGMTYLLPQQADGGKTDTRPVKPHNKIAKIAKYDHGTLILREESKEEEGGTPIEHHYVRKKLAKDEIPVIDEEAIPRTSTLGGKFLYVGSLNPETERLEGGDLIETSTGKRTTTRSSNDRYFFLVSLKGQGSKLYEIDTDGRPDITSIITGINDIPETSVTTSEKSKFAGKVGTAAREMELKGIKVDGDEVVVYKVRDPSKMFADSLEDAEIQPFLFLHTDSSSGRALTRIVRNYSTGKMTDEAEGAFYALVPGNILRRDFVAEKALEARVRAEERAEAIKRKAEEKAKNTTQVTEALGKPDMITEQNPAGKSQSRTGRKLWKRFFGGRDRAIEKPMSRPEDYNPGVSVEDLETEEREPAREPAPITLPKTE